MESGHKDLIADFRWTNTTNISWTGVGYKLHGLNVFQLRVRKWKGQYNTFNELSS